MNKNLEFVIKNGEVTITKCKDKNVTEVVIPSEIEGYPVKRISDLAFFNCLELKTVKIEEGVRTIGYKSFFNCLELTTVEIPNTVIKIASLAFGWCPKLKNINFPTPNVECRIDCTSGLPLRQCVDGNWRV